MLRGASDVCYRQDRCCQLNALHGPVDERGTDRVNTSPLATLSRWRTQQWPASSQHFKLTVRFGTSLAQEKGSKNLLSTIITIQRKAKHTSGFCVCLYKSVIIFDTVSLSFIIFVTDSISCVQSPSTNSDALHHHFNSPALLKSNLKSVKLNWAK